MGIENLDENLDENKTELTGDKEPEGDKKPDGNEGDKEPEGDKKPDGNEGDKDPEGDKKLEDQTPEKYEDFKLPEGLTFNDEIKSDFEKLAKEKKMSQKDAQGFVDVASKVVQKFVNDQAESNKATQEEWIKAIKEDKEFGGAKYDETISEAKKVVKRYGSQELADFLNDTGLGNNPTLIKTFAKIYGDIGEAKFIDGGKYFPGKDKTPGQVLYN